MGRIKGFAFNCFLLFICCDEVRYKRMDSELIVPNLFVDLCFEADGYQMVELKTGKIYRFIA